MANKLTNKQEMFCREYLIDLNGTQAAIRAGYSVKTPPKGKYYTYALVCGIRGDVFYIGKGKGARVYSHQKNRNKPFGNILKKH